MIRFFQSIKSILIAGCFCFITDTVIAQNWELDVVRKANSADNSSVLLKYTNASAKPVSLGMPVILFATALATGDKNLQFESYEMLGGLVLTIGTTEVMKRAIDRPRPYQRTPDIYPNEYEDGKSFPSGHASVAYFTAASLSINHPKWYVIVPSFGWALGVSYARLYYGQHHPTDLLASAVVGAGSAWIANTLNKQFQKKQQKKISL